MPLSLSMSRPFALRFSRFAVLLAQTRTRAFSFLHFLSYAVFLSHTNLFHSLQTPGVIDCHELHIWSLSDNKIIASVHVTGANASEQMSLGQMLKELFHSFDIHSVTIQQEFPPTGSTVTDGTACFLSCSTAECNENVCCPVPKEKLGSVTFAIRPVDIDEIVAQRERDEELEREQSDLRHISLV